MDIYNYHWLLHVFILWIKNKEAKLKQRLLETVKDF